MNKIAKRFVKNKRHHLYLSPRDAHQQKTEKSISDIRIFEELYKFLSATYNQGSKETTHAVYQPR